MRERDGNCIVGLYRNQYFVFSKTPNIRRPAYKVVISMAAFFFFKFHMKIDVYSLLDFCVEAAS